MMIKITERCTMNCPHCMNNAMPSGKDMPIDMFRKSLNFLKKNNIARALVITGGEPTEHNDFDGIMNVLFDFQRENRYFLVVTVTTNGEVISRESERFRRYVREAEDIGFALVFQVSADIRYYPRRIPCNASIFQEDGFILCDNCVIGLYPQGRALTNGYVYKAKAPRCFNVRALVKQINNCTLEHLDGFLFRLQKFCTPHIKIDGGIGLGESDLCPICASIDDSGDEIIDKIRNFKCQNCKILIDKLDPTYKEFLK